MSSWEAANKTELVQLLNKKGIRVHRGTSRKVLLELLDEDIKSSDEMENPVDAIRDKIMAFLDHNWSRVKGQIEVDGCDANCYGHHDLQVLTCWLKNREVIERSLKRMPKKKKAASLREELESLSPFKLKKRAKEEGLKAKDIKEASEDDLVDMIMEKMGEADEKPKKKAKKSTTKKRTTKKKKVEEEEEDPEEEEPEEDPDEDPEEDDDDDGEEEEEEEKPKKTPKKRAVKSGKEDDLSVLIDGMAVLRKEMAEIREILNDVAINSMVSEDLIKQGFGKVCKGVDVKGWPKIVKTVEEEFRSDDDSEDE